MKLTIRHILAAFLAIPVMASLAGFYPYLSRSVFQEPYKYDESVVALYHLDEKGAAAAETEDLDLDKLPTDDGLAPKGGDTEGSVRNDSPMGAAGGKKGDCELVAEGRFGGGLAFKGGDGRVMGGDATDSDGRTLEFWLKLDELPKADATLMTLHPQNKQDAVPTRLLLKPDGALQLMWRDQAQPATAVKLAVGQWTHVSLGWNLAWPDNVQASLRLNGQELGPFKFKESTALMRPVGAFLVGNDAAGRSGFKGTVDEIRFSKKARSYYAADLAWVEPDRKVDVGAGQPYFREASDLLFRAAFNKSLKPDPCAPKTKFPEYTVSKADEELTPAKVRGLFPSGLEGTALMAGDGSLSPVYQGEGNLLPAQGTIAFWLQPINWDNVTRENPFDGVDPLSFGLFQIDGEYVQGSYDRQFRPSGPLLEFNIHMQMAEGADNPPELAPGRWTHIAMTWEGIDFVTYINGQRRSADGAWSVWLPIYPNHDPGRNKPKPEWWLQAKPQAIRFGARTYWEQLKIPAPKSAIDDFRVYKRPLAPAEIANLVRLYDPRETLQPLPPADMAMRYNGVAGRVNVDLIPLGPNYRDVASAAVAVLKDGAKEPAGNGAVEFGERHQGSVEIKTPPLEFASYRVTAELKDAAGKAAGVVEQSFVRKQPAWWGYKGGISDKVMPDWTPMEAKGNVIKVWGRDIHLGASGLPEKIVSLGADILAGPVTLSATAGGKPVELAPAAGPVEITAAKEVRVDARGGLTAADMSVGVSSYTEFDGMMWFTVTLAPAAGKAPALDGLVLRIPFAAGSAEYIHWWTGERNFRDPRAVHIGALPAGDGVVFRSNDTNALSRLKEMRGSFIPYVCLAGHQRGMAWFAENDQGWTPSDDVPAVSVERAGAGATLVLRLISSGVTLDGPRTIAFGLHPVPVKALDKEWRRYPVYTDVYPDTFCGNNLKGRSGPTDFALYPEDSWEAVNRRINGDGLPKGVAGLKGLYEGQMAGLKKEGVTDPPPQTLTVPGLYWDLQWNAIPAAADAREWAETWAADYQYYTPEFLDFSTWCWNEWIEKTGKFVRGAYMDDCWGGPQTKAGGPTVYALPDGHVQPGFQFRGYRERIKRMRQISWDHGVVPHLTSHTTHTFFVPYHSFFDLILDGEDFYSMPPNQDDFIDHWKGDYLQFMNPEKWGLVTTWLGWTGGSTKVDRFPAWTFRQTRAYTASLALHDIIRVFDAKVMKEFGLNEPGTEFVPYWNGGGLATHEHRDLRVSAWKRPGLCLVLLANVGTNRLEAVVKLDRKAMGLGEGEASAVAVQQADPTLLTYFKEDATTTKGPDADKATDGVDAAGKAGDEFSLEERAEDLTPEQRRARDPDGTFEWKNGTLTCPVRRHDYRLFVFRAN